MGAIGLGWHSLGCYLAVPYHAAMASTSHSRPCLLCVQLTRSEFVGHATGIAPMARDYGKKHYSVLREFGELRPQDFGFHVGRTRAYAQWTLQGSNLGLPGYEPGFLPAEIRVLDFCLAFMRERRMAGT